MPFLDWVNKNQAKETTQEVPYHLLKQESVHGDMSGANAGNLKYRFAVKYRLGNAETPADIVPRRWLRPFFA